MTFLVLLIALLVERFFDFSHLRVWFWVPKLDLWVRQQFKALQQPAAVLAASVLPVVLGIVLIDLIFRNVLYGFAHLVLQIVVLLYCFGPRNLWADAFSCVNAASTNSAGFAEQAQKTFGLEGAQPEHLLAKVLVASNVRVFAIVFWYALLGVAGAVLYRLVEIMVENTSAETPAVHDLTVKVLGVLNWLPVRAMSLLFALAGNFAKVMGLWTKKSVLDIQQNETLLIDSGFAATVDISAVDEKALTLVMSLLDRAFILTLAIVLVIDLIF